MGYYINPKSETKESFLMKEGQFCPGKPKWEELPEGMLPVVLIDNGLFTAAGIAFSKNELDVFTGDNRRKTYYLVETKKLYPVSDLPAPDELV